METDALGHRPEDVKPLTKDQTIFLKGDLGNHMYVLLKGQVEIKLEDRVVDVVNAGGIFGEMGLIDGSPRAATAIAVSDGAMLEIDEKQFVTLVRETPFFALKMLRMVSARVRRADALAGLSTQDT